MCKVLMCSPTWNKVGGHGAYVSKTTAGEYVERMESCMSLVGIYCMMCKSSNYPKEMRVYVHQNLCTRMFTMLVLNRTPTSAQRILKKEDRKNVWATLWEGAPWNAVLWLGLGCWWAGLPFSTEHWCTICQILSKPGSGNHWIGALDVCVSRDAEA